MKREIEDYDNATQLAEDYAQAQGHDEWLDDETHPVWEVAADVWAWAEMLDSMTYRVEK